MATWKKENPFNPYHKFVRDVANDLRTEIVTSTD